MDQECTAPICEFLHAHQETVERLRSKMLGEERVVQLSELYKAFGDGTRVKILCVLLEAELCVCDIAALVGMTVSAVSHQLRILRSAGLVKFRKEGKAVFYTLADGHVRTILDMGMAHISE